MAKEKLRGRVKFFLKARRVMFLTLMRNIGTLKVAPGKVDLGKGDVRDFKAKPLKPKVVQLKNTKTWVVVVLGEYANKKGTFDAAPDEDRLTVPSAQLQTTITNDPPSGDPIEYEVLETEDNPQDEPGEDPEF